MLKKWILSSAGGAAVSLVLCDHSDSLALARPVGLLGSLQRESDLAVGDSNSDRFVVAQSTVLESIELSQVVGLRSEGRAVRLLLVDEASVVLKEQPLEILGHVS